MTNTTHPTLIVIMGVAGSGKTTLASALAHSLGWHLVEADDFHSPEAVAQMQSGQPLTDAQRLPWMQRIANHLSVMSSAGTPCLLAWSGLRKSHRDLIRALPFESHFFLLSADRAYLQKRLDSRSDHFMPGSLLDSQLETLEWPEEEEKVQLLDCRPGTDQLALEVIRSLKH